MKRAPEAAGGQDMATAVEHKATQETVGRRTEWDLLKWNRVGLRCGSCHHEETEDRPEMGKGLLERQDILTHHVTAEDGGLTLVGVCPKCGGHMDAFSPDHEAGLPPDAVEHM